jgi:xeroderma pigmentosum group C-complementing protein
MSDSDSSDSSNDFAGITPRDELTASFFSIEPATSSKPVGFRSENEDESSGDDNFTSVPESNGIELFSEVVKNLEASQRTLVSKQESKQHSFEDDTLQDVKRVKIEKRCGNISDEINAVLLQGESGAHAFREDDGDLDDDDDDIKEPEDVERPNDYSIPKDGVKITLPGTNMFLRKKLGKKESDLAAILRRKLKANQIIIEKAARLCWLAYGFYLNRQSNDTETMATIVSLISTKNYPNDNFDLAYLAKFTKWFRNLFTVESSHEQVVINKETLLRRIEEKKIYDYRELVILYVAILRGIGLHCRLIVSLNPPPVKTFNELLPKSNTVKKNDKAVETLKQNSKGTEANAKETKGKAKQSKKARSDRADSKKNLANNSLIQNSENARRDANLEAKKRAAEILRSKYSYNKKDNDKLTKNINAQNSASTSASKTDIILPVRHLRSSKRQSVVVTATKRENNVNSETSQSKTSKSTFKRQTKSSDSSSEKEEEESSKKLKRKCASNKTVVKSKGKDIKKEQASTDDEEAEDNDKLKKRQDVWAEVYVESKGSWICVNVLDSNVDCIAEVYVSIS